MTKIAIGNNVYLVSSVLVTTNFINAVNKLNETDFGCEIPWNQHEETAFKKVFDHPHTWKIG
jgi:hypothetical protein